jgi:hypothetical protein
MMGGKVLGMRRWLPACLLFIAGTARAGTASSGQPPVADAPVADVFAASEPAVLKPAPASAPFSERPKLRLSATAGGGLTTQDETQDNAGLVRFAVSGDWEFANNFRAGLSFGSSFYSARYLTVGPAPDGSSLNRSQVSEQRYDLGAGVSYRWTLASGHLDLEPWLGLRSNLFRNTAAPQNLFGVAPDLLVRVRPGTSVAIEINGGFTYNLITPPTSNALGRAQSMGTYGIAGRYFFAGTPHSVRLGFVGDVLTLAHSYRLYDTVEATYTLSF